ncbi:hypothetical protein BKI52_37565 [marine bacterium AO1-C]|nr:hypothetical protein BKI52_37565 [marine bacterium AO1-C]
MKIISLQLKTQKPTEAIDFYTKTFGMTLQGEFKDEAGIVYILQFPKGNAHLELLYNPKNITTESYQQNAQDNYWKYSVFVEDIQQIYRFLKNKNISSNEPYQFGDIGYLMHTKDQENYQVEFIQRTFQQNTPTYLKTTASPDKAGPLSLGLITLRTKDPVKSIQFYENLGLKLLVRMYVERGNGFTLYFLGRKDLTPPNADIDAIENREWLYQQEEAFIELQYYWGSENQAKFTLRTNQIKPNGLRQLKLMSENLGDLKELLDKNKRPYSSGFYKSNQRQYIQVTSPDEHQIVIE